MRPAISTWVLLTCGVATAIAALALLPRLDTEYGDLSSPTQGQTVAVEQSALSTDASASENGGSPGRASLADAIDPQPPSTRDQLQRKNLLALDSLLAADADLEAIGAFDPQLPDSLSALLRVTIVEARSRATGASGPGNTVETAAALSQAERELLAAELMGAEDASAELTRRLLRGAASEAETQRLRERLGEQQADIRRLRERLAGSRPRPTPVRVRRTARLESVERRALRAAVRDLLTQDSMRIATLLAASDTATGTTRMQQTVNGSTARAIGETLTRTNGGYYLLADELPVLWVRARRVADGDVRTRGYPNDRVLHVRER